MKIKGKGRKVSLVLVLSIVLQLFIPMFESGQYAASSRVIDEVSIEESDDRINNKKTYNLKGSWSIDDNSKKKGDQFTLDLSSKIEFNTPSDQLFLVSPDGKVYAEGRLDRTSGQIVFTFTDLVEKEIEIKGTFFINGLTTKDRDEGNGLVEDDLIIKEDDQIIYEGKVEVNTGSAKVEGGSYDLDVNNRKSDSVLNHFEDNQALWSIDLNAMGTANRIDGIIELEDRIGEGHYLVPESLTVELKDSFNNGQTKVVVFRDGKVIKDELNRFSGASIDYSPAEDNKSFKLKINTGGYAALVQYKTELEQPISRFTFNNYLDISYKGKDGKIVREKQDSKLKFADMGGTGEGRFGSGTIKIKKINEKEEPLTGATFRIINYRVENGELKVAGEKELTTDEDGIIKLDGQYGGLYKIEEVKTPEGYLDLEDSIERFINFEEANKHMELWKKYTDIDTLLKNIEKWEQGDMRTDDLGQKVYSLGASFLNYEVVAIGNDLISNSGKGKNYLKENFINRLVVELERVKEEVIKSKDYLEKIGYSIDENAFVIKVENRSFASSKVDFELTKKWDIDNEYKDELKKGELVGKFKLRAYKIVDGKPSMLNEKDDENILERLNEIYEIKYSGKDEDKIVIEDLDETDRNGNKYVYSMEEVSNLDNFKIDEGMVNENKQTITNTYTGQGLKNIEVKKHWNDDDDKAGKRPESIQVILFANAEEVKKVDIKKEDGWSYTFKGLDKYNENQEEIVYRVEEEEVEGYKTSIDGFNITNSLVEPEPEPEPEEDKLEISVKKEWQDVNETVITDIFNNHEGVSVELYYSLGDGEASKYDYESKDYSNGDKGIILSPNNNWTYTFKDLPKYDENGIEYIYSVRELGFEDFESSVSGEMEKGFVIVNKLKTKSIEIEKIWKDSHGEVIDNPNFDSVTIDLLKDGGHDQTISLSKDNDWKAIINDLPAYRIENNNLVDINYSIREKDIPEGYRNNILREGNKFIVENIENKVEEPLRKILKVKKEWHIEEGSSPEPIIISLLKDGKPVEGSTVKLSEENNWSHEYKDLDYDAEYRVEEKTKLDWIDNIEYDYDEDLVIIRNIEYPKGDPKEPEDPRDGEGDGNLKKTLEVKKEWHIEEGSSPEPIIISLLKDGKPVEGSNVKLSEENNWSYEYKDLDYDGEYKVEELTKLDWIDDVEYQYDTGLVIIRNVEYPKVEPVDPEEPEEPEKPVEPVDPEEPEEPEKPVEPVDPKEPEEPEKPEEPEEPEKPEEPEEPEKPVEPVDPEEPEEPEKPVEPVDPEEPEEPEKPVEPVDPEEPEEPEKPVEPVDPKEPEEPEKPVEPVDPEEPEEPEKPVEPVDPEEPEEPEKPVEPVDPEEPEKPVKPVEPVDPKEPEESTDNVDEESLPKTGEDNSLLVVLGLIVLMVGLVLNTLNRKKVK